MNCIILPFLLTWNVAGGGVSVPSPVHFADDSKSRPKVTVLDESGFARLVAERKGKILVLNVWATWCTPCVEEFPDLAKLDREYKDKNVQVVLVSIDDSDDLKTKVIPFLQSHHAAMKSFINGFSTAEKFINTLNASWSGAIPATFVFDAKGKQHLFLLGKQSYQTFKEAVEQVRTLH